MLMGAGTVCRYIWLPMTFNPNTITIQWRSAWDPAHPFAPAPPMPPPHCEPLAAGAPVFFTSCISGFVQQAWSFPTGKVNRPRALLLLVCTVGTALHWCGIGPGGLGGLGQPLLLGCGGHRPQLRFLGAGPEPVQCFRLLAGAHAVARNGEVIRWPLMGRSACGAPRSSRSGLMEKSSTTTAAAWTLPTAATRCAARSPEP